MSEANVKTACPSGHDDTVKLLSTIAVAGSSLNAPQGGGGGGCCGGGCGC